MTCDVVEMHKWENRNIVLPEGDDNLFLYAANKCCLKSFEFVISQHLYRMEEIWSWLNSWSQTITPQHIGILLDDQELRNNIMGQEQTTQMLERWCVTDGCKLVDAFVCRMQCASDRVKLLHLRCVERVDNWCSYCFEKILGSLNWKMTSNDAAYIGNFLTSANPNFIFQPRFLGLVEDALGDMQQNNIKVSTLVLIEMHHQILPLLMKYPNVVDRKNVMLQLFRARNQSPRTVQIERIVHVMQTFGLVEDYHSIKCPLGLKQINELAKIPGFDNIIRVDHESMVVDFAKCPWMIRMMDAHDLASPCKFKPGTYVLEFIIKKMRSHVWPLWLMHPDAFFAVPIPKMLRKVHHHVKVQYEEWRGIKRVHDDVVRGICIPLLMGMRQEGCILSALDNQTMRMIIKMIFS